MEIAASALSSLVPKLGSLLSDEYKLHKGVQGEIMFLKAELESMQAALNKVSRLPAHQVDDLVKIWASDVKELSYDIEDSIEAVMVDVDSHVCAEPHGFRRFIERSISLLTRAKSRRRIALEIKDIKSLVQQVAEKRERYRFQDIVAQSAGGVAQSHTSVIDPRLLALYEDVARLVGIDGPAEKLINLLIQGYSEQKQQLKVVSIVGVGGLGKTTLANSVYQRLKGQFQCHALVSVSLKPDMKNIFSSILRQVSKKDAGKKSSKELIDDIRQFFENKRYFVVIDDVWDKSEWKLIKCALIENNLGSRIIVTTRKVVAELSGSSVDGTIFELEPLSNADSKRLFYRRIFNNEDGCPSELKEASEKILKKCGGLPLAIITIASLLANKPATKHEWCSVYNCIGSGHEEDDSMENMRWILSLSYYDLPSHLKPCLLYLSMFPEDYEIRRQNLVQRWVAEGFIDVKQGRNLYELGVSYFNELVNRSLIQPVSVDSNGSAEACRIHDMILDLIILLSTEENFVTRSEDLQLTSLSKKIRRLYIQDRTSFEVTKTLNLCHVRSLSVFGRGGIDRIPPLSRFPLLRTLDLNDLESCHFKILKDGKSLRHLRYMSLKLRYEIGVKVMIPYEVGNLHRLKTLDLREVFLLELPDSIVQLKQLECLLLPRWVRMPDGISNMRCLQELSYLDIGQPPNVMAELRSLTELRVLDICAIQLHKSYAQPLLQCLRDLGRHNLHALQVYSHLAYPIDYMSDSWWVPGHLRSFRAVGCQFSQLPRWISSLSELSCLSIEVKEIRKEDIDVLGALPVLYSLGLVVLESEQERLMIGIDQGFHCLTEFEFRNSAVCWLTFGQGAMPNLRRLTFSFSFKALERENKAWERQGSGFDIGLENLTSLQSIRVGIDSTEGYFSIDNSENQIDIYSSKDQDRQIEDAKTAIRNAICIHPNHPTFEFREFERKETVVHRLSSVR